MQKGAIEPLTILMWTIGLLATTALAANGVNLSNDAEQSRIILEHEGRISAVEVSAQRVLYVEAKVDKLLEVRGIDPDSVSLPTTISNR